MDRTGSVLRYAEGGLSSILHNRKSASRSACGSEYPDFSGWNVILYAARAMELVDEINKAMLQEDQVPDLGPLTLLGLANATDLLINITLGQMLRDTDNVMQTDNFV